MSVLKNTRYENSEGIGIQKNEERVKTFISKGERVKKEDLDTEFDLHQQGEREYIDIIAVQFTDNPTLYSVICDINNILDPFEIVIGKELLLPSFITQGTSN